MVVGNSGGKNSLAPEMQLNRQNYLIWTRELPRLGMRRTQRDAKESRMALGRLIPAFGSAQAWFYRSSSALAGTLGGVWVADFYLGAATATGKTNHNLFGRPVRRGSSGSNRP